MIGKQCAVSDRQVPRALNGISNALCAPSRFCSKALSQKVKLPFTWNDAIHLCQSAKLGTQAAPLKLIPCFASDEFTQIQEDGSGCTLPACFNVAIPEDFAMQNAMWLYLPPKSTKTRNRCEEKEGK